MNIRSFITALLTTALCVGVFGAAEADRVAASWKIANVVIRTSTDVGDPGDQGYIDSTTVTLGALSAIDTSTTISLADQWTQADSLQMIRVEVIGTNAFASGESLYVTFDGFNGKSFTDLGLATCGTCNVGGFGAAGALVPGANSSASKLWNGAGSATAVHVAQALAGAGPGRGVFYGNFSGYPAIRVRIRSDSAVVPVVNTVRYRLWYLSSDSQ
jgi:hypothetical protein